MTSFTIIGIVVALIGIYFVYELRRSPKVEYWLGMMETIGYHMEVDSKGELKIVPDKEKESV